MIFMLIQEKTADWYGKLLKREAGFEILSKCENPLKDLDLFSSLLKQLES